MDLSIDKQDRTPLYHQVYQAIERRLRSGELETGAKLPPTRELARRLGVHRNTVVAAYRRLEEAGWVRSAVGAGTFVTATPPARETLDADTRGHAAASGAPGAPWTEGGRFSWGALLRPQAIRGRDPSEYFQAVTTETTQRPILLNGAVPDSRNFPMADFSTCMQEVLEEANPHLLEYGATEGYAPLRAWIAQWLTEWGVPEVDARRIFVVSGSQQGLDLIARLLVAPGDRVLVEAPTYTGAYVVLQEVGARVETVPFDDEGIDVAALEAALERDPVRFLYLMPCYQNPTGVSLSATRRTQLLDLAHRRGLAIVEDHYTSQLHYRGAVPRPLLADDAHGRVIQLGTFSKILFPGLRLGWMVVPDELRRPVRRLRWATDLSTATFTQQILHRFCVSGRLTRHLERICRIHARRLDAMLAALEADFPAQARWTRPEGGMTLWAELPDGIDTVEVSREAARRGVLVTPGSAFFPNGGGHSALRLSFNRESEERIRKGVRLLSEVIDARLNERRPRTRPNEDAVPFV